MRYLKRKIAQLSTSLSIVAGFAAVIMMVHMTTDIVLRTLLGKPLPATIEIISYYYMIILVFLPLAAVEITDSSISADFLYAIMPKKVKIVLQFIILLTTLIVYLLFAYVMGGEAIRSFSKNEVVMGPVPLVVWPSRVLVPLGFLAAAAVCVVKLAELWTKSRPGTSERGDDADAALGGSF